MAGRDASTDIATCGAHTPLMTRSPSAIPVRPLTEDRARVTRPADYLAKAAVSMLLSVQDDRFERDPRRAAAALWPGEDGPTQIHLRAATATATTGTNTWASQLATVAVADLLSSMGGFSAGGELLRRGTQFQTGQAATLSVPGMLATPGAGGAFVSEAGAIPVKAAAVSSVTLTPRKMAVLVVFTSEILDARDRQSRALGEAGAHRKYRARARRRALRDGGRQCQLAGGPAKWRCRADALGGWYAG